jgi:hypothetical protein
VGARALILLSAAAGLAGCRAPRARCGPTLPSTLEVSDGHGAALSLKESPEPGARDLCDASGKWLGLLRAGDAGVTLTDASGAERLKITRTSPEVATALGPSGPRLRLYRDAREARVLLPDGVPLASVTTDTEPGRATVRAPSSLPLAQVAREAGAQVVRSRDDRLLATITPPGPAWAAGVFAVDALTREERVAVFLYWSR